MSFNPLTGISSILTRSRRGRLGSRANGFQSPDGDFVYSDPWPTVSRTSTR